MSSLTAVLQTATSGLSAAQIGLRTVSDDIANVNTPGYVRKVVNQQQLVVGGSGMGVDVLGVARVTDQYLQAASLTASSDSGRYGVVAQFLDSAQALFGDPSGANSLFSKLDTVYSGFAAAADDPSSTLLRGQAVSNVQNFLTNANSINTQINQLGTTVDSQINNDVQTANGLLSQIDKLNVDIRRATLTGGDASGSQNNQSQLLDQLSNLMNIKVSAQDGGGVTVRSTEGVVLAGEGAATLAYNSSGTTPGYISASTAGGGAPQAIQMNSGELRGLLDLRNTKLPGLSDQLGTFVNGVADQLNAAHNASSAVPPPHSLTGRNTGLDLPTLASGFSGKTSVAIVNTAGVVQQQVDIDFSAGTMVANGGAPSAFTPATFLASLNTALGGKGSASFSGGALSITATAAKDGVAIDEGTSAKAGDGFSHFFGLNDLVRSSTYSNYNTGLSLTDANGFTPGDTITLRLSQADGKPVRDVTVTVPAAPLMSDLVNALNNNTTGVGLYGQFSLDANGALTFAGTPPANASLSVVKDTTQRGVGGPSISQLFGLGVAQRTSRAANMSVDPAIVSDPTQLALAKLNLSVASGTPALAPGDGSGARALAGSGGVTTLFQAAGGLGQVSMTVSAYAAQFGGSVGRDASNAQTSQTGAAAVKTAADARRQSVEGVNIDEELVRLTTYQQAFNASARMIQASKDLFDALLNIV